VTRPRAFKKLGGSITESKMQENTSNALAPLQNSAILDGVLLKEVSLVSGTNYVSHKLRRKIQGWAIVRKRANVDVWDDQDNNVNKTTSLKLETSGDVVIDLWIF